MSSSGARLSSSEITELNATYASTSARPINVLEKGAVGDGVANDTAVIQAAIATGRDVHLPAARYKITSPLVVTTVGQEITGVGSHSVIVKATGSGIDGVSLQANSSAIRNVAIESTESGYLVTAGTVDAVTNFSGIEIIGCHLTSTSTNAQGIRADHIDDVTIERNILRGDSGTNNFSYGIVIGSTLRACDNAIVRDNRVYGYYDGIKSLGTGAGMRRRALIAGNVVTNPARYGIDAYHCARSRVVDNHCIGGKAIGRGAGHGIWADSSSGDETPDGNVVANNIVQDFTGPGIITEELAGASITGNTVLNCGHGIVLSGGTYSTSVVSNVLTGNAGHGIWADKEQTPNKFPIGNMTITGNVCRHNDMDGMRLGGLQRSNVIANNECSDNGKAAASLYAGIRICPDTAGLTARNHALSGNSLTNGALTGTSTNTGGAGQQAWGLSLDSSINGVLDQYLVNRVSVTGGTFEGNSSGHIQVYRASFLTVSAAYFETGTGITFAAGIAAVSYGPNFGTGAPTQNGKAIISGNGSGQFQLRGTGTPESVVTASPGSTFLRTDGGAATTFYVKETGTGNTGWVAK